MGTAGAALSRYWATGPPHVGINKTIDKECHLSNISFLSSIILSDTKTDFIMRTTLALLVVSATFASSQSAAQSTAKIWIPGQGTRPQNVIASIISQIPGVNCSTLQHRFEKNTDQPRIHPQQFMPYNAKQEHPPLSATYPADSY